MHTVWMELCSACDSFFFFFLAFQGLCRMHVRNFMCDGILRILWIFRCIDAVIKFWANFICEV